MSAKIAEIGSDACATRVIEFAADETDDGNFLELAQQIVNGALVDLHVAEVYVVHVDNWFDHKWLGWWSNWRRTQLQKLFVPPFVPNRIKSQTHFVRDAEGLGWITAGHGKNLHVNQSGRHRLRKPLDRVTESGVFVWYSGNSVANQAGSLMLYQSGAEDYAWYASFLKNEQWKVNQGFRVTRRELNCFEERGRPNG